MNDEAPAPDQLAPTTDDDVDSLHFAICQAVHLMNQGDLHAGHDLLRQTLVDFADKKAPLSRTEIIRQQQRSGAGEVSAIMVSPEPRICVLCGHAGKLNSNGVCVRLNAVKVEICGCICEFPPAAPAEERDKALARKLIHGLGSINKYEDRINFALEVFATVRAEEREAAFKVLCPDCANGDVPALDEGARWFYHTLGDEADEEVGCSASKLRLESARGKVEG